MENQMSAVTGRVGSIGAHDIETGGGSPHHGVDRIEMTRGAASAASAAAEGGGGGATDIQDQEEEAADMEMAATITADDPHASSEEEWIEGVQISDNDGRQGEDLHIVAIHDNIQTLGSAGGGGATDQVEGNEELQSVQGKRDSGIFPSISAATISLAAAAILRPTPKGLHSENILIVAYTLDLIMLLVLGILLFALTFALALIPDNWVSSVLAAATTVTAALLVLLLFLVAFVTYGLVRQELLP